MRRLTNILVAAGLCGLICTTTSYAVAGIGVHWGFDFSLRLGDTHQALTTGSFVPSDMIQTIPADQISRALPGVDADSLLNLLQGSPVLAGELPISLSRTGWDRYFLNIGGKAYLDIIPVIDAVEISMNFGLWQYNGVIRYPVGLNQDLTIGEIGPDMSYDELFQMAEMPLTLERFGMSYFGLSGTPYARLHLDMTIRKSIIAKPSHSKLFKLYAGGGPSVHFATPVLSQAMIEDVIGSTLEAAGSDLTRLQELFGSEEQMKLILEKIVDGLAVPKWGMHLVVGIHAKIPVLPVGLYGDAKLMIPFGDMDKDAPLKGYGFLFNTGLSIGL